MGKDQFTFLLSKLSIGYFGNIFRNFFFRATLGEDTQFGRQGMELLFIFDLVTIGLALSGQQ